MGTSQIYKSITSLQDSTNCWSKAWRSHRRDHQYFCKRPRLLQQDWRHPHQTPGGEILALQTLKKHSLEHIKQHGQEDLRKMPPGNSSKREWSILWSRMHVQLAKESSRRLQKKSQERGTPQNQHKQWIGRAYLRRSKPTKKKTSTEPANHTSEDALPVLNNNNNCRWH